MGCLGHSRDVRYRGRGRAGDRFGVLWWQDVVARHGVAMTEYISWASLVALGVLQHAAIAGGAPCVDTRTCALQCWFPVWLLMLPSLFEMALKYCGFARG